jgi:hypothetical protein
MVFETMTDFINCPLCSGHENVSREAASAIEEAIDNYLKSNEHGYLSAAARCELENIRNVILNTQDREKPIDPLLE